MTEGVITSTVFQGKGPAPQTGTASRWHTEIEAYRRAFKPYMTRCDKIARIYLNQHIKAESSIRRFALLWSNISTLQPAVYAKTPTADVSRRFKDSDPTARMATEVLERASQYTLDSYGFDPVMRMLRDDFLLFARATAWVRYEPTFRSVEKSPLQDVQTGVDPWQPEFNEAEDGALDGDGVPVDSEKERAAETYEEIDWERACFDYVHRRDFGHSVSRYWEEVWWGGRRCYLTRAELIERFPEKGDDGVEIGRKVPLDHKPQGVTDNDAPEETWKASVWEIWSKRDQKVYFVAEGYRDILEESEPFLKLKGFWPFPKPAYGTLVADSLIPVPDYVFYSGQAEEIDELTAKIGTLQDALKLVGFYPAGPSTEGTDAIKAAVATRNIGAELIPVAGWQAFTEKGGASMIQWVPIDQVVKALQACIELRSQLITDVYQITGISDIVRGDTDPNETATAQGIKAQWGSIRIRDRQLELARLADEIIGITGEIIADKFQPGTLTQMTGVPLEFDDAALQPVPPPGGNVMAAAQQGDPAAQQIMQQFEQAQQQAQAAQQAKAVIDLLRNDASRGFRISVNADSMVEADEQAERMAAVELTTALTQFVTAWAPVIQVQPALAKLAGELLMFSLRRFKAGRELEQVVEETMTQLAQPPAPQGPDPAAVAAEAEAKAATQISQNKVQESQAKTQASVVQSQAKIATTEAQTAAVLQKNASDIEVEAARAARELMMAQRPVEGSA